MMNWWSCKRCGSRLSNVSQLRNIWGHLRRWVLCENESCPSMSEPAEVRNVRRGRLIFTTVQDVL